VPDAPLSPRSSAYVLRLRDAVQRYGAWINTTQWSTAVYTVGAEQPTTRVTLDKPPGVNPGLRAALAEVPIPGGARPSLDADAAMVIWQPCTDRMWEFWRARLASDGWHAAYGGAMTGVSQNVGYFPRNPGWGATATGLPLLGGLIRIGELRMGRIPHAVAVDIPDPRAGVFAWPAQRTDGTSADSGAIPEGTRFRLDPSLDLSKLQMSPVVRALARAAQEYGMIVIDRAGAVAFSAEDPTPTGGNPYAGPTGFFGGRTPGQLLQQFPWSALQVIKAPLLSG
jgi:hypothetical protein